MSCEKSTEVGTGVMARMELWIRDVAEEGPIKACMELWRMGPGVVSALACRRKCGRKKSYPGTSLVVECLRICLAVQWTQVPSQVWELKSHMPWNNLSPQTSTRIPQLDSPCS